MKYPRCLKEFLNELLYKNRFYGVLCVITT